MTPAQGARIDAAVELGFGGREHCFGGLELRFEIDQVELRHGAGHDQLALGVEFGLALGDERFRLSNLGLARLVGQDRDDIAGLDPGAATHFQFGQHAAGARRDGHALVGLGAAGEHELAAVRLDMSPR